MSQTIQQTVDAMNIVMAAILAAFTLLLVVVHIASNTRSKSMQRIRAQVLRLISVDAQIEYLREQIHSVIDGGGTTFEGVRGIRTQRGLQVLEAVSREVAAQQAENLRLAVEDGWYSGYISSVLASNKKDAALIAEKLLAQLDIPGYTELIEKNLSRWCSDADAQQICLLVLFVRRQDEEIFRELTDPDFRLLLSFRTLRELFRSYRGDKAPLYTRLLKSASDPYVIRACIRGIGMDGCDGLCGDIVPLLKSQNLNIQLETVRTLGMRRYAPAAGAMAELTANGNFAVRCAAVDALWNTQGENSYDIVVKCLCDRDWWVRFHAAQALVRFGDREKLLSDVACSGDRYAGEMLRYMIEREELLKGVTAA